MAVTEVMHEEMLLNLEMIVRSDRVFENEYKAESPEVIEWTNSFYHRANVNEIFAITWEKIKNNDKNNSAIIGTFWHHFSSLAPKVMSIAAGKVSNNLIRHYIVQIIFEELGSRNHRLIHPDIFLDCLYELDVNDQERNRIITKYVHKMPFQSLLSIMDNANSDSKILGILLGLEIDAEENITTIHDGLIYNEKSMNVVKKSSFFRIHKIAEKEHIRLNVANFLKFCPTDENKQDFLEGFDEAVNFWRIYWASISEIIDMDKKIS
jgi:hypothetical protein